jgi:DNA-binding transcriptional regulator YiaG
MTIAASARSVNKEVPQVQKELDPLDLALANPSAVTPEMFAVVLRMSDFQNRTWENGKNILHKLAEPTVLPDGSL